MGVKFGMHEGTLGPPSMPIFTAIGERVAAAGRKTSKSASE